MDDADLAAREHANLVTAFVVVANMAGGVARRTDGVAALLSGLPVPGFNLVLAEDASASPEALAGAVALARERGAPFAVDLRVGTDDRFVPLMAELGLVPCAPEPWAPGMALHPVPAGPPATRPGHEIREIVDRAGIRDHVRIATEAFGIHADVMSAIVNSTSVHLPCLTVYVGYADGEAVSAGLGVRSGRTIGVYNVAVAEGARRRGYGEAMTRRIAADGVAGGCDVAVLQATPMGRPLYERLGYRQVVSYMGYVEPALAAGGA